jgi:glucose-6-phosphate 1-dehydrogenase
LYLRKSLLGISFPSCYSARGGFYETAGALRDMVQNHLIQLVALTAMEPPAVFNADNFRNEVVKVYESLTPLNEVDLNEHIVRGQYTASNSKKGYREEKGVNPESRTETYIAMKLGISNWRWSGVPFYIRTGKQMPTKVTEIVVHFKETPHQVFHSADGNEHPMANKLILRLQPNEGIVLKFGMKMPGPGFEIKQVTMDFSYDKLGGVPSGDAYARLIEDCILGDATLFTRSDAVEASWKFFDPVLNYWTNNADAPLYGYPAGTWGPLESEAMMHEHGAEWTNPCKNLTNTDQYCEL